ncbi:ADP-ribosylglycohydrolase [Frigoriglobus tundricola]|uniref:ADP-ribosylglycohydrolase n=1 Tax=Frigoriglobus tundricola TaxID=2774151 RepID=A0A6M5YHT7_9BACT|nr:ADP-ribosylglycohydrolase family protein [Frigoriglobus tundricola]QJW92901.1 ADP-ribosylglycohydrolase [Frigoriglobus tundricola]
MTPDRDAVSGCLLGLAVGDALGLPCENLSARRAGRLFPHLDRYQFFFRRGAFSDDTEHACLTGQALLASGGDPAVFLRDLAWRLRWWAAGLPAGTGRATITACARLWLGWSPERSGVFSAGNGPAMRAPLLGTCLGPDRERLRAFVRASTRVTHADTKAECGALAVAWAAHRSATTRGAAPPDPAALVDEVRDLTGAEPASAKLLVSLGTAVSCLRDNRTTEEFAAALGLTRGVSGYMYHTVPVALYAWLRHPDDYRARCSPRSAAAATRTRSRRLPARWWGHGSAGRASRRSGSAKSSTGRARYGGWPGSRSASARGRGGPIRSARTRSRCGHSRPGTPRSWRGFWFTPHAGCYRRTDPGNKFV